MAAIWRKYWRVLTVAALALWATGCVQLQDQLSVNKDGSGSWRYKIVLNPQMTAMMAQAEKDETVRMNDNDDMPPVMREQLEATLAKIEGAKLVSFNKQTKDGSTLIVSHVEFASIEAMMASELASTIGWYFTKDGDEIVATASPLMGGQGGGGDINVIEDFGMAKGMLMGMRINRRLSLPTAPTGGNAHATKDNLAAWDFRMSQATTEDQMKTASTVLPEYRTSAAGITFKLPLGEKPEKPVEPKDLAVETNEVEGGVIKPQATRATLTRRVKYGDDPMHFGSDALKVSLRIPHADTDSLLGYTGPFYVSALDDKGTDLRPKKHGYHKPDDVKKIHGNSGFGNQPAGFDLDLDLALPDRTAETCSISGHLFLHLPGETKTLKFDKLGKKVGKMLENPDGLWIKLEDLDDDSINLKVRGNWMDSIQSVEAFDKDGKQLDRQGSSRGKFGDTATYHYSYGDGTPDRIEIKLSLTVNKQKVPFAFDKLELP